jgi:hypothetical protein
VGDHLPFTIDEESSGIIDVTDLFRGASWYTGGRIFLADVQAHYLITGELVEGGQLLLLQAVPEPGTAALVISGLLSLVMFGRCPTARRSKVSKWSGSTSC